MKTPPHSARSRGFALVITLSLMMLLTVVAVGLLTLSSVSLRASGQGDAMATARSNARLAMMIALGELQKTVGPDQGVTARADILGSTADTPPGSTDPTKSKWTGAWNKAALATPPTGNVRWLVSGSLKSNGDPNEKANEGAAPTGTDVAAKTAARLVGTGTADTSAPGNEIIVPLQTIQSLSSATTTVNGAMAWWVGDEGVKTRVNPTFAVIC